MSQIYPKKLLRFGCPACGIRLVVDQSIAGSEGPCPSCGARIIAPPLEVERSLKEKEAAPLDIKPRDVPTGPLASSSSVESNAGEAQPSPPAQESANQIARCSRSISPTTALSEKHLDSKNTKAFFKMLVTAVVVVCIAMAAYYLLQNAQ